MKKVLKTTLSMLLCLVLCLSCLSNVAFAENGRPMPVIREGTYYAMSQVKNIEKGKNVFTITLQVNGKEVPLHISMPSEGGVRMYTDQEGVFKPDSVQELNYTEDKKGNLKLTAKDNTYLVFRNMQEDWEIEIGNIETEVLTLKGSELCLGMKGEEIVGVRYAAPLHDAEAIYGTGERYNEVNQVGNKIQLWNLDTAYHIGDENFETKVESYNNVPFIHSTNGYSMFFNSTYCIDADFGATDASRMTMTAYGPKFDFYFWTESALENIASYTNLTGRAFVPPKWAFHYWAGAGSELWKQNENGDYISIVQEFINGYKKMGIQLDVLYGEYPITTDKTVYSTLKKDNITMLMWNPCYYDYDEIMDNLKVLDSELPIVRSAITPWLPSVLNKTTTFVDYTHENAKELVKSQYQQYVKWGMKGLMVDMGEKISSDTIFSNGMTGDEMHNLYSYYYVKTINEAFTEMNKGKKDFILFERSGCAGSQAYAASFTGDQTSKIYGLKQQLNGGLSMSTSGFTIWGGDIGGYYGTPSEDSYIRWVQFSAFEPLMREHGVGKNSANPWYYGTTAENVFTKFYWLRENMVDMIYSAAVNSGKYGSLVTTPLVTAYPEDTSVHQIEDEYIFCDNLLVCPITENDVTTRQVTLPKGTWYNLWDGTAIEGGQTFEAEAPKTSIPVYLKSGALMPVTVSDTFELTEAFEEEESRKALVVTAPESKTSFEAWDDEGEHSVVYTNEPVTENVYRITASDEAVDNLMAYGTVAKSVKVDGVYLPRISKEDTDQIGYYIDGHEKTVVILPDGDWNMVEISTENVKVSELDVSANAIFTDNKAEEETPILKTLHNEDAGVAWTASSANGTYLQAELDDTYVIDTVSLKWGQGHATEYNVEVSEDGENFETVFEATGKLGGQDIVTFQPVKAKYVRITNIKKGAEYPASVYNFKIYKAPDVSNAANSTAMYYLSTAAMSVTGGNMTLFFITIACAVVAVGAGAATVVVAVKKRKKKKEVNQ